MPETNAPHLHEHYTERPNLCRMSNPDPEFFGVCTLIYGHEGLHSTEDRQWSD